MVLVRGFSKEHNAVWALYLTILSLFETIKQGMLRNPTIKFLNMQEYSTKKVAVQSAALMINIIFSLIALIALLGGSAVIAQWLKSPELLPLLLWSTIFVLLLIPFNHFEITLQSRYKFPQIFWAYFVRQGMFFTGIVVLYFFFHTQFTLFNLLILQLVSLFVGTCILYYATKDLLLRRFQLEWPLVNRMFQFGKYIFGTNLFSNLARSFDHFITANTLNPVEGKRYVSYYNVASRINNMLDMPSLAAADVLFPKNVETLEQHGIEKVKYYFERMVGTILAIIFPMSLFIFLFPKFIIYILAGSDYYDAIPVLQITILLSFIRPIGYQYGSTLDAIGKPAVNFWSNALMMVVALGTTWYCLVKFDGIGAAYATVVNNIVNLVIMVIILKKYIGLEVKNIIRYTIGSYRDAWSLVNRLIKR